MSTTIPVPQTAPPAPNREAVRCDRCSARAVAVSHHDVADLGWCGHHLRKHLSALEAAGVSVSQVD